MSRYLEIVLASPPSVDFPSLVAVQDEHGSAVELGEWLQPDGDNPFWRYRLSVGELLQTLVADVQAISGVRAGEKIPSRTPAPTAPRPIAPSPLADQRAALRAKVAGAQRKAQTAQPEPVSTAATETCPACNQRYDPSRDELIDCTGCGASKCTARCMTGRNLLDPCKDCDALAASPDEGGFDPSAEPPAHPEQRAAAGAVSARLFDNQDHGKSGEDDE